MAIILRYIVPASPSLTAIKNTQPPPQIRCLPVILPFIKQSGSNLILSVKRIDRPRNQQQNFSLPFFLCPVAGMLVQSAAGPAPQS